MDKISVIVPVYNVETYISKCLDSIACQSHTNLEVICIDDGSTDSSGLLCDAYAKKDARFKVFHKANGGQSSAYNLGLDYATGEYVGFVDSDDWIKPDMFETLYTTAKNKNASICVAGYYKETDEESIPMVNKKQIPDAMISTLDMLLYPLKRDDYMGFCGYAWNKLFSSALFTHKKLRYNNSIDYGGDVLLYTEAVLAADGFGFYVNRPLYHYYQRNESISKSEDIHVKMQILNAYKKVETLLIDNGYASYSFLARGFYCHHASVIAEMAVKTQNTEALIFAQREIKQHLDDYIKTNATYPEKLNRMNALLHESATGEAQNK